MLGIIFSVIVIITCFLFLANTTITFNPFSIKLSQPYYAIGWFLIVAGIILIRQDEYKKGLQRGVEIAIEEIQNGVQELRKEREDKEKTDNVEKLN